MMKRIMVLFIMAIFSIAFTAECAAAEIPKAAAKALGTTKGKPCSEGLVFVNGKYIEPPYVVERWGNGIRINGNVVVPQAVDWTDFIKTQPGVKITKTESAAPEASEEESGDDDMDDLDEDDDSDDSLDDLFDDDPKPKKSAAKKPAKKPAKKKAAKPTTTVSYTLEGEFVANDASNKLKARVNKLRTDINTQLLKGGVMFFGDNYARVSADAISAEQVLMALPDLQKRATSAAELSKSVRAAGMVYLTQPICRDLYKNRVDYIKLQQRREKWKRDREFKKMLNGSGSLY